MFFNMMLVVKMQCFGLFILVLHMKTSEALSWDWDDKTAVLYPSLPIVAPWSENEICRNHSRMLLQALNNFTLWAVQMLDSSATHLGGVLYGNVYQLGNFNECLEVNGPLQSQYCLAKVTVNVPHTGTDIDPYIQKYDPESSVWDKIKNSGNPARVPRSSVYQALCVPASCSHQDIETAVSQYLQKYQHSAGVQYTVAVAPNLCQTSQQEAFSFEDYIFICVIVGVVILVIAGTTLDYICSGSLPGTFGLDLLFCFSARQSMKHLNQMSSSHLDVLTSLKFICACIITLNHRGGYFAASPLWNLEYLEREFQSVRLALMHRGEMIVDNFFVISGILVAYILLQELPRKRMNPLYFILFRIFRLTPALIVIIFFYATLFYKLGSGPRWDVVVGPERDFCQKNWWTNLLFINNYVNEEHMCLLQSYFLACDMHFFIIAIPVVMLLWRRPNIGAVVLVGAILVSILIPFLVTYLGRKPALVNFYIDFLLTPRASDVFLSVYIKSHARASPYFVGIAMGYMLYNLRNSKQKFGVVPSVALCCGVVCLLFGTLMSGFIFYDPARHYNPLEVGLFAGLHRFVWALGVSAFIVIIMFGKLPVISSLLSSRILVSLGNLTYCMFLVHPVLQYWNLGSLCRPEYFHYISIVVMAAGDIAVSLLAALFLYLTVEEPCRCMMKQIVARKVTKQE